MKKYIIYLIRQLPLPICHALGSIAKRKLNAFGHIYREWMFDVQYKTNTRIEWKISNESFHAGWASKHMGTPPRVIKKSLQLIEQYNIEKNNILFLDLGAGKGRALLCAAMAGFKKIIGVELNPNLCKIAQNNLIISTAAHKDADIKILNMSAADFFPDSGNCIIYMFNPFGENVTKSALNNIIKVNSASRKKASIYLIYIGPIPSSFFEEFEFKHLGTWSEEEINIMIYKLML